VKQCPSCGEENADKARFCQNCATPLGAPMGSPGDVRRVVTIVFADVTGSTSLGERLDPEALRRVMGRYFDEMSAVIERHGGTVEKFIGDAVMAVFGIPRLHEDDALRAVRAASGMREALEALNVELEREHGVGIAARIGVNTGEVVAGDPSAGQRLVTGDAVNVAARLEQAASPGEIFLGEATHRLVRDAVEVEPVAALDLKGKEQPVPAYRLVAVLADVAGHERHLDSPMVGRGKELEMLDRALERAITERTSHLFTLLGAAGVGKSRLVSEFLDGSVASATVLRGRCLSYGEGITFFPLAEVIHQAADIVEGEQPAAARAKLHALLAETPDGERIASLVGSLFGWDPPGATDDAFWAVRKVLEDLAGDRPVVVVFDDIHWAEPTLLDLIEHLADWTRDAAVLLLCLARPELLDIRAGWGGGKMNATSILLEPLPGDEASMLIDNLLGRADIPQAARDRILDAAEGNPLFVEEMLAMLIDDGLLRFEDGSWRSVEDLADLTVPPTIHLLLAARLDRLDAEERAVIERGAVEGKVFHTGAVTTLSPDSDRPNVRSRLLALARKELIRPDRAEFAGEDAFRFRHLLIRDAAYQAMPKEHRADLHERFAEWLSRAAADRIAEYEEILGHHLEQAYRYRAELGTVDDRTRELGRKAAALLRSCAERADERDDLNAALAFLGRSVELAEGSERVAAMVLLAEVLIEHNDLQRALDTATEAGALAGEVGDRRLALRAELVRCGAIGQLDPTYTLGRARDAAETILAELETLGDEEVRDRALILLTQFAFFEGRTAKSFEIADRLAERAESMRRRDRQAVAVQMTADAYFGALPLDEAFRAIERAAGIVGPSLTGEAENGRFMVGLLGMAGRFEEARATADRSLRIYRELGMPTRHVTSIQVIAETERLAGRLEEAERLFRASHEAFEAIGETGFNSTICGLLAQTLCDLGRFDEAEEFSEKSRTLAAEDDFASQAAWRMARARVFADRGQFEEALTLADEAVAINAQTDYIVWQGDGHEVRGQVLLAAGRGEDARAAFEEALARYQQKGTIPAAARIRAQLDGLVSDESV
jgi:class 3 adenylate cyclase/tetratricopeptide (TPR) repeat protein